jgi:hypothetical protein
MIGHLQANSNAPNLFWLEWQFGAYDAATIPSVGSGMRHDNLHPVKPLLGIASRSWLQSRSQTRSREVIHGPLLPLRAYLSNGNFRPTISLQISDWFFFLADIPYGVPLAASRNVLVIA